MVEISSRFYLFLVLTDVIFQKFEALRVCVTTLVFYRISDRVMHAFSRDDHHSILDSNIHDDNTFQRSFSPQQQEDNRVHLIHAFLDINVVSTSQIDLQFQTPISLHMLFETFRSVFTFIQASPLIACQALHFYQTAKFSPTLQNVEKRFRSDMLTKIGERAQNPNQFAK